MFETVLNCCHVCYDHDDRSQRKHEVGKHQGTSPCNLFPEEFTQRDWLQGLVLQTVLKKCLEEQVTGTCPKNFTWFELIRVEYSLVHETRF